MRIRNSLKYAADMVKARVRGRLHLSLAFVYPTYRCNLRCVYCENLRTTANEHSVHEWRSVFEQLSELGCWRVTLLGGEPLIRQDIAHLIQHIRDLGMKCVLTSNGLLVPEKITELLEINTLVLSLDAACPSNDELRGKGVFNAVKEAIKAAKDAGIPVKINSALSAKTTPDLNKTLLFLEQNDIGATFNIIRAGPPRVQRIISSLRDSDDQIRATLIKLASYAGKNNHILFSPQTFRKSSLWPDFMRDMYTKSEIPPEETVLRDWPLCQAGRFFLTVGPEGDIFPCVINAEKIIGGNAFSDGIQSCWENLQSHDCVACYSPCLVELNQLFSLDRRIILRFLRRHLARYF